MKPSSVVTFLGLAVALAAIEPALASEACCSVAALDVARQQVTLRTNDGRASFVLAVADASKLRGLKVGQPASLSGAERVLYVQGATPLSIPLASVRYVPAAPQQPSGAVASAASSGAPGTFKRDAPRGGKCPPIKETSTEQCVLTHDRTGEGKGCEYFCVPLGGGR
jgi:hypothetical protein